MVSIHTFETTEEAYDTSQCAENIKHGDVLVATEAGVVGFMYRAWPAAVTIEHGKFHTSKSGFNRPEWDDCREYIQAAQAEATRLGLALAPPMALCP